VTPEIYDFVGGTYTELTEGLKKQINHHLLKGMATTYKSIHSKNGFTYCIVKFIQLYILKIKGLLVPLAKVIKHAFALSSAYGCNITF